MVVLLLVILFVLGFSSAQEKPSKQEGLLIKKLFQVYNPMERPVKNEEESLNVIFGLTLQQLIDVILKDQIVLTNLWLDLQWSDHRLKWDDKRIPVTQVNVPVDKIWKPDVMMYNSADENFDAAFRSQAIIYPTGQITWIPPGIFASTCKLNIRWFPFDTQSCKLEFGSWAYDLSRMNLTLKSDGADLQSYFPNGEWSLLGMPAEALYSTFGNTTYTNLCYTINIRRRALYYVFNLIIPALLISSIALLTFILPPESGEKISLGVTILLSLTVFLLVMAETLPPTSDAVPLIGIYFACIMIMSSFSLVFTCVVITFASRSPDTYKMPNWIKRGVCVWLAWLLRIKRPGRDLNPVADEERQQALVDQGPKAVPRSLLGHINEVDEVMSDALSLTRRSKCQTKSELSRILKELTIYTDKIRENQKADEESSDWRFAALVIDKFCLYVFCTFTFVSSCAILFSAPGIFEYVPPVPPFPEAAEPPPTNDTTTLS